MSYQHYQHFYSSNWFYLLHALIFLLFLYPYTDPESTTYASWFLTSLNSAILLIIIYSAGIRPYRVLVGFILASPALILQWLDPSPDINITITTSTSLLYLYAIVLVCLFLQRTKEVGINEVFAAISLYLLLGFAWTTFYQILTYFDPSSFYIALERNSSPMLNWSDFLYYSFVTLTTLGYGDITPVTAPARSLAVIEAITGILFIPMMISSFIGLYLGNKASTNAKEEQRSPERR